MVKITDGVEIIKVSKGAFESYYEPQGFYEIDSEASRKIETEEEFNEEQKFIKDLEEKPLASWSKNEVKEYCSLLGLDISKTKNASEAKEIIKNFMSNK